MKEITVINKISELINKIDYQSAYIEIRTEKDKWTIEKEKQTKVMGFRNE